MATDERSETEKIPRTAAIFDAIKKQSADLVQAAVFGNKPRRPATSEAEDTPLALTENQTLVLATMAQFDGSRLLSAARIEGDMRPAERLSQETIRKTVAKLIKLKLAERPEGPRSGARLTMNGRRLVPKIAD